MVDERAQLVRQLQRYYALLRGTTDPAVQQKLHALIKPIEARLAANPPASGRVAFLHPRMV